ATGAPTGRPGRRIPAGGLPLRGRLRFGSVGTRRGSRRGALPRPRRSGRGFRRLPLADQRARDGGERGIGKGPERRNSQTGRGGRRSVTPDPARSRTLLQSGGWSFG